MNLVLKKREEKGWSQTKLSMKSGVPQTTISAIERDIISPTLKPLVKLASAFGCQVSDLIESAQPATPTHFVSPDVENDPEWAAKRAYVREKMREQLFGNGVPKL